MQGWRAHAPTATAAVAWVAWLVVAAFVAFSLGSSLLGETTFLGVDILGLAAPWKSSTELASVHVGMLGDTIDTVVPQSLLVVDAARSGQLAEWNPYQNGGVELGGLPNSGIYSPLSLPWWILPYEYAPGVVKLLEIVVVAIGFSLFLRRLELPRASWAVATLVFVSSGFMISWTNWPQTRVAAFIPLLFWALDRAAVRCRWTDAVPVGLVTACMLLGGFPAVTAYALYLGAAYVIVRAALCHRSVRQLVLAGLWSLCGVVLGFVLAAWQIVPFAVNATSVIDFDVREQTSQMHLPWAALATTVAPDIFGAAGSPDQWGGANAVERLSYLGAATVVLVAAALAVRPTRASRTGALTFTAVAALVCVVLIFVGGVVLGAAQLLPVFSNNPIGRLRVILGFCVAVLAAFGLAAVLSPRGARADVEHVVREPRQRWVAALRVVSAAVVGAAVLAALATVVSMAPDRVLAGALARQAGWIALSAALLVLLAWVFARRWVSAVAAVLLAVLVVVPAITLARSWWPQVDKDLFYPTTATHAFLEENLGDDRFATVGQTMLPGTNSAYRLRSLGGHSFLTAEWKDVLLAVDPDALLTATYSVLTPQHLDSSMTDPILDRLAVRYVVADPASDVLGELEEGPEPTSTAEATGSGLVSDVHTGPLRGVRVSFPAGIAAGEEGAHITAELLDEAGGTITSTSTWVPGHGGDRWIALAGDELADSDAWRVRLSVQGPGVAAPAATLGGVLAVDVVRPADDGVVVAHTGDATVYERTTAAPRVRWASSEVVEEDLEARLDLLADPGLSTSTVVLEDAQDARSLPGSSSASLEELSSDDDEVVVSVDADGEGWVVVADSFRRAGWTATLDGDEVPLIEAEHVGGAVFVEPGEHVVELTYSTPGLRTGTAVSVVAAGLLVALGAATGLRAWRSGRRAPERAVDVRT